MGRSYAGILAALAFVVAILRGWLVGAGVESTLLAAWLSLLAFAAVGYICGQLAEWIVRDSVRAQVSAELAAREAKTPPPHERNR